MIILFSMTDRGQVFREEGGTAADQRGQAEAAAGSMAATAAKHTNVRGDAAEAGVGVLG
jgi:hypothetical protein